MSASSIARFARAPLLLLAPSRFASAPGAPRSGPRAAEDASVESAEQPVRTDATMGAVRRARRRRAVVKFIVTKTNRNRRSTSAMQRFDRENGNPIRATIAATLAAVSRPLAE